MPYRTLFYLQPHIGGQESPLTRTRKVYGLSAPRWIARLSFRAGQGDGVTAPRANDALHYAARLDALIAELQGGLNCALLYDFRRPEPQSHLSRPLTLLDAASAGDTSIAISLLHGTIGPSIGDYVGGDGRPHIVTRATPVAGSMMSAGSLTNTAEVMFQPPLSAPIAAAAVLPVRKVTGRFRLASEDAGANEGEVGAPIEYALEFTEELS